ncbi:MAG: hypothetical protein N3F62_00520 [Bacteroidia bacterium]|nr:hypothetical protein [Bacteroidia bacterium]
MINENPKRKVKEVYVRDAQGNILALYQVKNDSLYTKEFYMYGSQRLGYLEDDVFMGRKCISKWCNVLTPVLPVIPSTLSNSVSIVFGKKRYELSDWLGNVRVVINDRKTPINSGNATVGYKAQVVSVTDYYSFGGEIAERTYDPVKPFYRFGFNTQEKTFELNRDHYTAKFWEYDARLGRRWNVDLIAKSNQSPYSVFASNPILFIDINGLDTSFADNNARKEFKEVYNLVSNKIESLENKVNNLLQKWNEIGYSNEKSNKRMSKKIENINKELSRLHEAKTAFDQIIKSDIVFQYSSEDNPDNMKKSGGSTKYEDGIIKISYFSGNYHSIVHETRHAFGFIRGEWGWDKNNNIPTFYDYQDEYEGYNLSKDYLRSIEKRSIFEIYGESDIKDIIKNHYFNNIIKEFRQHCVPENK